MLDVVRDGAVLRLTLNRPEVKNALNADLIAALTTEFRTEDPAIRIVVLRGAGGAFCAGADLSMMRAAAGNSFDENVADALRLADLFEAIATYPALVVAAVEGPCFGGGGGLMAGADLALVSEDVKISFSEVRLGLIPATISPYVISKVGSGHARALFMTADTFGADRALQIGLGHIKVPVGAMDAEIESRIKAQLAIAPGAARNAKLLTMEPILGKQASAERLADARASEEAREGLAAFFEKRKPGYAI